MPGYQEFRRKNQSNVNNANLSNRYKKIDKSKHILRTGPYFLKKAIRKLKRGWEYRIKFPSVDWAEK